MLRRIETVLRVVLLALLLWAALVGAFILDYVRLLFADMAVGGFFLFAVPYIVGAVVVGGLLGYFGWRYLYPRRTHPRAARLGWAVAVLSALATLGSTTLPYDVDVRPLGLLLAGLAVLVMLLHRRRVRRGTS